MTREQKALSERRVMKQMIEDERETMLRKMMTRVKMVPMMMTLRFEGVRLLDGQLGCPCSQQHGEATMTRNYRIQEEELVVAHAESCILLANYLMFCKQARLSTEDPEDR